MTIHCIDTNFQCFCYLFTQYKPFFINRKTSNSRFVKGSSSVSDKSINICSPVLNYIGGF